MSSEQNLAINVDPEELRAGELAPRPHTIEATGLSTNFLCDLIEKHLFEGGVLSLRDLVRRSALSGRLLEEILGFLRKEGRIEIRAQIADDQGLRYGLTERGRGSALAALTASGYIGPAPVPLAQYVELVRKQAVRAHAVTREHMHKAFADVILPPAMLDRLGPAVNSGKAIFVYGAPGAGKTYVTQKLARLFDDACLIPHAIAVDDTVIRVYDPSMHRQIRQTTTTVMLNVGHDPRYAVCRRPVVITGGELTADMLEIQYDAATRQYRAPLQLKASNGVFILDDLGRQRVAPAAVLNRWIVPMEEGVDYLTLNTGQHFSTPFDVVLVFSTNLNPHELVDGAFLRRIGYKIRFDALDADQYHSIWRGVCEENDLVYDPAICQFTIDALHAPSATPMLPCHPRDLIGMALDRMEYLHGEVGLRPDLVRWAWENYFVTGDAASQA
jgi:hypothetical protein